MALVRVGARRCFRNCNCPARISTQFSRSCGFRCVPAWLFSSSRLPSTLFFPGFVEKLLSAVESRGSANTFHYYERRNEINVHDVYRRIGVTNFGQLETSFFYSFPFLFKIFLENLENERSFSIHCNLENIS